MKQEVAQRCCVPVSCKAAVSWCCCTPLSILSSSELMLVTTSPSRPTSAMPFQKVSVSSAGAQASHSLPRQRNLGGSSASLSPEISPESFLSADSGELQSSFPLRASALSSPPLPWTT